MFFYKSKYVGVLKEYTELKEEFEQYKIDTSNVISSLEQKAFDYLQENSKLKSSSETQEYILNDNINTLTLELALTKEKLKKANTAKGGYVKEINKLKKLVEQYENEKRDLNAKISDLQSDRYLIKKIPTGRTKNTVKTKISAPMKSSVRKFMKENFDD